MAKLTDEIKDAIVARLARFEGYTAVAASVSEAFGVELSRFHVRAYDADAFGFAAGERWRQAFRRYRAAYLQDVGDIPIAHCAFRLNQLQELYWVAKSSGNTAMAMRLLRHAAAEAAYYERDKPAADPSVPVLSLDDRRRLMAEMINQIASREGPEAPVCPDPEAP